MNYMSGKSVRTVEQIRTGGRRSEAFRKVSRTAKDQFCGATRRKASEGNPQVGRGDGAIEIRDGRRNAFGALLSVMYHFLDAGLGDRHHRELGRHEGAVHSYQ